VIRRDEVVVAYLTGNGLKTQEAVEHVIRLLVVEPTVASFQKALNGL
jgi:threonine synthase